MIIILGVLSVTHVAVLVLSKLVLSKPIMFALHDFLRSWFRVTEAILI